MSRPKTVRQPVTVDPPPFDYAFYSPDVAVPSYAEMEAELEAVPEMNLDEAGKSHLTKPGRPNTNCTTFDCIFTKTERRETHQLHGS